MAEASTSEGNRGKKTVKTAEALKKEGVLYEGRWYDYQIYPEEAWAQIAKHGKVIHPMGDQEDTIENASGVEDNGELGFGYGMNPVAALEHSDTEPSGSANSFTVNKRQKLEHRVSTLKHAVNELKNRPMSHTNQSEENEFDIFGLYVSTSLKKLSLPRAFRLQEKINSLIAEERISYASQTSPYSNNGMAAINHRSDNDDMDHSSESSYITDRQNDIKAEEIEIECVPEIRLSL